LSADPGYQLSTFGLNHDGKAGAAATAAPSNAECRAEAKAKGCCRA